MFQACMAVVMGERGTRTYYAGLVGSPFVLVSSAVVGGWLPAAALVVWLALPLAVLLARRVLGGMAGRELNPVLERTAQLHLAVGCLLALGLVL